MPYGLTSYINQEWIRLARLHPSRYFVEYNDTSSDGLIGDFIEAYRK